MQRNKSYGSPGCNQIHKHIFLKTLGVILHSFSSKLAFCPKVAFGASLPYHLRPRTGAAKSVFPVGKSPKVIWCFWGLLTRSETSTKKISTWGFIDSLRLRYRNIMRHSGSKLEHDGRWWKDWVDLGMIPWQPSSFHRHGHQKNKLASINNINFFCNTLNITISGFRIQPARKILRISLVLLVFGTTFWLALLCTWSRKATCRMQNEWGSDWLWMWNLNSKDYWCCFHWWLIKTLSASANFFPASLILGLS